MNNININTWAKNQAEEDSMNDDHYPLWLNLIDKIEENDLTKKIVLDFGCNQGGFLKTLFKKKPFLKGHGIDIAKESIKIAKKRNQNCPIEFHVSNSIDKTGLKVDMIFSHEVIYLLKDLQKHAVDMYKALRKGGVYYLVIGCHTDNPLWSNFKILIREYSHIPFYDYSLNFISDTFRNIGFTVQAKRFSMEDYMLIKANNPYFPNVLDSLNYYNDYKIIFKLIKK